MNTKKKPMQMPPQPDLLIEAAMAEAARLSAFTHDMSDHASPDRLTMPGFEMSDEPFDAPVPTPTILEAEDLGHPDVPKFSPPAEQAIEHDGPVSYISRIQILEAYRYMGHFRDAPVWINRNWLSHGDFDPLRKIEPGPALRVPLAQGVVIARIGDYVCQQAVTLVENAPPDIRLEVWAADQFEKLFIPRPAPPRPNVVSLAEPPAMSNLLPTPEDRSDVSGGPS